MSENTNNNEVVEDIKDLAPEAPATEPNKTEEVKVEEVKVEEVKAEDAPEANDVITAPAPAEKPGLGPVGNGAMGVTTFKKEEKKPVVKSENKSEDKVAIYSTRNVTWSGIGKVYIGYNIVTKEQSEQWLKRNHIRLATPEEVAKEFSK